MDDQRIELRAGVPMGAGDVELADLFVELVLLGVGLLAYLLAAVAEEVGQAGQGLFTSSPRPGSDARRTSARSGWCLVRLDGLNGHPQAATGALGRPEPAIAK